MIFPSATPQQNDTLLVMKVRHYISVQLCVWWTEFKRRKAVANEQAHLVFRMGGFQIELSGQIDANDISIRIECLHWGTTLSSLSLSRHTKSEKTVATCFWRPTFPGDLFLPHIMDLMHLWELIYHLKRLGYSPGAILRRPVKFSREKEKKKLCRRIWV